MKTTRQRTRNEPAQRIGGYFRFSPSGPMIGDVHSKEMYEIAKTLPEFFPGLTRMPTQEVFDSMRQAYDAVNLLLRKARGSETADPDREALLFLWKTAVYAVSALNSLRIHAPEGYVIGKDIDLKAGKMLDREVPWRTGLPKNEECRHMVQVFAREKTEWPVIVTAGQSAPPLEQTGLCPLELGQAIEKWFNETFSDKAKGEDRPARRYAVAAIMMIRANKRALAQLKKLRNAHPPAWFKKLDTLPDDFNRTTARQWAKLIREMIHAEDRDFWKRDTTAWNEHIASAKRRHDAPGRKIEGVIRKACLDAIVKAVPTVAR